MFIFKPRKLHWVPLNSYWKHLGSISTYLLLLRVRGSMNLHLGMTTLPLDQSKETTAPQK